MVGGLLDSGLREKFGQVAVGELELAMKSTGNPNTQPSANRSIIGTMRGVAQWQYDMAQDMQNYVDQKGGSTNVTARELRLWQAKNWNDKLADYVDKSKASLPVEGELKISDDGMLETVNGRSPKKGYQYMVPSSAGEEYSGMIVVYDGKNFVEAQ
jgi:hypothetical protein